MPKISYRNTVKLFMIFDRRFFMKACLTVASLDKKQDLQEWKFRDFWKNSKSTILEGEFKKYFRIMPNDSMFLVVKIPLSMANWRYLDFDQETEP